MQFDTVSISIISILFVSIFIQSYVNIKLHVFIISSLFPYFNLFVSIFIQSYVNISYMFRSYILIIHKAINSEILLELFLYSNNSYEN